MLLSLLIFGSGAILGLLHLVQRNNARLWRSSLVAYELHFPRTLTPDQVSAWLAVVANSTARTPIVLEVVATHRGIGHFLLVPESGASTFASQLRTALPGIRVDPASDFFTSRPSIRLAAEYRLTNATHPLSSERAATVSAAALSLLHPLARGEVIRLQTVLRGTRAATARQDDPAEVQRAMSRKHQTPAFTVTCRVAVSVPTMGRAVNVVNRLSATFQALNTPRVSIVRLWLPSAVIADRVYARTTPLLTWPMLLNSAEAVGVLTWPLNGTLTPGVSLGRARQLPPPSSMPGTGVHVANSNYSGMEDRALRLATADRLMHTLIQGPTGVGKSTLMTRMIVSDIAAGRGVVVVDPKGDLVLDVLERVPAGREQDVIVLDAAATDRPVGYNLLASARTEQARELVVDHVVRVFSELWRSSWGPRTSDCLRACLLTLTHTQAADGSAFAITEVAELLTNPSFRRFVTAQPSVPAAVRPFWTWYEGLSEAERLQVISPSLNKLRSLTTRTSLRLTLGQSVGIDLRQVFTERKILLVNLAKGTIGTEAAMLLGSLIVAGLWNTTLQRAAIPAARRRPVFAYLDEFHDVLRLGDVSDMLAQARGLGLGLVMAHQYLDQLPSQVRSAVLGTARSQIVFQVEHGDARALAPRFTPLTSDDLTGLQAHEIALRPCVNGQTLMPVTGTTLPLDAPTGDADVMASSSRAIYGVPRAVVEAALAARVTVPGGRGRVGRVVNP
jgi:hypothetical protein